MVAGAWREILIRSLVGTALLFLIMVTDPMGLDAASDRHSADVVSRITAPFYGGPAYEGRSRIAVVQISDGAVKDEGWPPSRMYYARLLKRVAGGEKPPAVVFFDYAFISRTDADDRGVLLDAIRKVTAYDVWKDVAACQQSALSKIKCISDAGGTPVIVGKVYPPNACLTSLNRSTWDEGDDVRLFHTAVVAPLGWPDLPTRFHVVLDRADYTEALTLALDGESFVDRRQPGPRAMKMARGCEDLNAAPAGELPAWAPLGLSPEAFGPALAKDVTPPDDFAPGPPVFGYDVTPATAMFYALCRYDMKHGSAWQNDPKADLCKTLETGRAMRREPAIEDLGYSGPEWGSVSDPLNRQNRKLFFGNQRLVEDTACDKEQPTLLRAVDVGWSQLRSGLGKGAAAVAVPCAYHFTVDAAQMANAEPGELDWLRAQFAGRAVTIGAAQALSNDWISTTLNAQQAGVHYHAMILDNLLEKGPGLRREPPPFLGDGGPVGWLGLDWLQFDFGELLELFCGFLVLLLIERTRRDLESLPQDEADLPAPSRRAAGRSVVKIWLARRRLAYRQYWRDSEVDRYRIGQVALTLVLAAICLVLTVGLTISLKWEPMNIVGLFSFTVAAVAFELWSQKGARAVFGQAVAMLLLAPAFRRHKFHQWFRRPSSPPQEGTAE